MLCFLSPYTFAKWEGIGRTEGADLYVDPTTINKKGNFVTMKSLDNLDKPSSITGVEFRSIISI